MPQTFVVPDLHGQLDLLDGALTEIQSLATGGTVVFIGDYVDRGPHSRQVIERLMAGPPGGWRWVCLKGNHEHAMTKALMEHRPVFWLENGGGQTLLSYGHAREGRLDYSVVPAAHIDWMRALPLYHQDAHRLYVHAGFDRSRTLDQQKPSTLLSHEYAPDDPGGFDGRHVVHGHRPHPKVRLSGRTALDSKSSTSLLVGVFDDGAEGGPVALAKITL